MKSFKKKLNHSRLEVIIMKSFKKLFCALAFVLLVDACSYALTTKERAVFVNRLYERCLAEKYTTEKGCSKILKIDPPPLDTPPPS